MNIIILTASTGGGHNRASNALKDYILSHDSSASVDILDVMEECSALINSIVVKGHKAMVTYTPGLFGTLYHSSDKDSASAVFDVLNTVYSVCGKRLLPIIEEKRPDVVISCHPFTAGIFGHMKTAMSCGVPLISIATDFIPHRAYITEGVDAYVTAFDASKEILTRHHRVPPEKVYVCGLPIYERFYEGKGRPRAEVLAELGLDPGKPTVLIMAGSFGFSDMLKIYESLVNIDADYQIIVITGRNRRLYESFEKLLSSEDEFEAYEEPELLRSLGDGSVLRFLYDQGEWAKERITATFRRSTNKKKPTKLFYFIDNVDDYMHASDLIITKPGGLTASESLACALPMAIFMAFPGQEELNASFLSESGTAVMLEKGRVTEQIGDLLTHPEKLAAMRGSCRRFTQQNSCENIYRLAKRLANKADAEQ